MKKEWKIREKINTTIHGADLHPITEQLLLQRGVMKKEEVSCFFDPQYNKAHDPFLFTQMERVVQRVARAKEKKEIIGIFGDHDADGISSATILSEALENLGFEVVVYIPDKITEGHGINRKGIDEFIRADVSLMFTVDCGTSNIAEIDYAKKKKIDVIVTDHHHVPEKLPKAYAIINPQLPDCSYPFRDLSGTAVAFKVAQALFSRLLPKQQERLKWALDVVCVGTVADCMPLIGENRIFVKYGLLVLSKTRRKGYREMISAGKINIDKNNIPSANTVAFYIAPRINAAGRMSHARHAYDLMRAATKIEAQRSAQFLEEQNKQRRLLTDKLTREIENKIKKSYMDKHFIIMASEDYPVGIVGIIAGKIAEKYGKPTGIFTKYENESRGSFRSVDGVDMMEILQTCAQYLDKFGGHAFAAGATIQNKNFANFCDIADNCVSKLNGKKLPKPFYDIDCVISLTDIDQVLVNDLKRFEPFGEGNKEPLFLLRSVRVYDVRTVGNGQKHLKMKITSDDADVIYDGIGFGLGHWEKELFPGDTIDIVVHIQENEWMGNVSIQLQIIDIAPVK